MATVNPLEREARQNLSDINWDFSDNLSRDRETYPLLNARKYHWYPATFIPELPYTLIELLSAPGDLVYDPFAGIGTTVWQAVLLGRSGAGMEITEVGFRTMKSLWTVLNPENDLERGWRELRVLLRGWDDQDYRLFLDSSVSGPMLRSWFSDATYNELAFLRHVQEACRMEESRALLSICISAVLKASCEQRRGWGCIADNMMPRKQDLHLPSREPIRRVIRHANVLLKDMRRLRYELSIVTDGSFRPEVVLEKGDARNPVHLGGKADLIVTSPPYPGMTDYSTSQRLSYYWYGIKPEMDLPLEIGARRKRFKRGWVNEYVEEMVLAMAAVSDGLSHGGRLALVLPAFNGMSGARAEDREAAMTGVLHSLSDSGLRKSWEQERLLPYARRHQNQRWTNLEREKLYLFVKD